MTVTALLGATLSAAEPQRAEVVAAMTRAAQFFCAKAASHGGYVYYYTLDFAQRWGEGEATAEQIFVQPPGTPAVGMALLRAHAATGDALFLDAAREAAEALVFGQLESGGWAQVIDFDPAGAKAGQYRNGRARGRNYSSLDDGITQSALSFLMHVDRALGFKHADIHEAAEFGRKSLLASQHPNGGFPQVWSAPAPEYPAVKASFPEYDWRTENRLKNYWDMPTLNDGLCGTVARTLEDAWEIYHDDKSRAALLALGDFLRLAQLPEPQPGWAQQYDHSMRPIWARKFEPPAVAGRESQDAVTTLLHIYRLSGEAKYLEPVPRAIEWLRRSLLPDGKLARFYELETNRPLYMTASYELTYDGANAPAHYGWTSKSKLQAIARDFAKAKSGKLKALSAERPDAARVGAILAALDSEGRWVSLAPVKDLVGQPKFSDGMKFLSSQVFAENLTALSDWLATK
ncbi:MAG TPA: pectate lyase [Chthoniobacteraceae bacterium]|nr:pectate lyase [Chthoniobacteraceae bacterium]